MLLSQYQLTGEQGNDYENENVPSSGQKVALTTRYKKTARKEK